MANLETLELTINGSAEKAGQGIDSLISRLSSLSNAITKPYSDLRDFNSALKETAKLAKSIHFGNLGKSVGAAASKSVSKKSVEQIRAWQMANDANRTYTNATGSANMIPEEQMKKLRPEWYRTNEERKQITLERNEALRRQEAVKGEATAQKEVAQAITETTAATNENKSALSRIKEGFGNMTKGAHNFFSKVKRIATTMLIRAAIRGLIRDMKEGVNNLYEWSKLNNGEFAKSFDTLKAKGQQLKNSLGAAIAPAIQAAIPVINALTSAAISAFNWVNQLIALLSGQSYWTKATDNVDAYTDSVNKAGGAAKEWIASFDELNVMTSGGGGGGGGASGITSDMFENTTKFSDSIREVADFIKRNFEDIKLIAEGIGVAILSWRLANSFLETLPALSKLAGLIGVGATIAITLKANYMLTNKYLETGNEGWLIASALTTAIGATAAGVIARKVFGGKVAGATISFALILSAVTDIIANVQHTEVDAFSKEGLLTSISAALKAGAGMGILLKTLGASALPTLIGAAGGAALVFMISTGLKLITTKENIKWGMIELTEKQVDQFVNEKMFETDVKVFIQQVHLVLDNKSDIEEQISNQLMSLSTEYNMIKLGINSDDSYNNIKTMIEGENGLTAKVSELCDVNVSLLKLNFGNIQAYDGQGNPMSSDFILSGMEGWAKVKDEMEANGKELTELLMMGAKGELTPEMEAYTQELLEKVTHMSETIAQATAFGKATAEFKENVLAAFSKNSFKDIATAFEEYSNSYEETIRSSLKESIASWYTLAELTSDPELKEKYTKIADDLTAGFEKTVAEKMKEQTAPGRQMILEWLYGLHDSGSIDNEWIKDQLSRMLMTDHLQEILHGLLSTYENFSDEEINVMKIINFSGWDLLSKDLKKSFLASVRIDATTLKELSVMEVPADELVELVNWEAVTGMAQNEFVKAVTDAYGASGLSIIKHKFPDIKASEVIKFSGWQEFSDTQKLEFVDAIGKAFGNQEAITAAKNAGIDLEKAVKEGMNSQNEDIRKMAKKWAEIMGIEIRGGNYTVEPKYSDNSVSKIPDKIKKTINSQDYLVYVTTRFNDGSPKNISDGIDKLNGKSVPIKVTFADGYGPVQTIEKALENFTPKAKVEAELTNGTTLKNQLKKALSTTITLSTKDQMLFKMQLNAKAGGGLVNSGDMFIANENGVPEMIGRFGNQTGVANTGQIVEGISRGVADANEQQNALLREQNALLRAIYEKDSGSGFPGANSALGRQIKRSLDAYNGLVGG